MPRKAKIDVLYRCKVLFKESETRHSSRQESISAMNILRPLPNREKEMQLLNEKSAEELKL